MNLFLDRIRENREYGEIIKHLRERENKAKQYPFLITGLCEGALDVFLASCLFEKNLGSRASLICVPDEKTAARLLHSLCEFGLSAAIYPERDPVLYNMVSSHELEHERIAVLSDILNGKLDAVIATPTAAISFTIPKETLRGATKAVSVGDSLSMDEIAEFLVNSGYVRSDLVDGKGKFSIRGGIIDVFPPHLHTPVRMELFGDEIDQIGYFDLMTQRKIENIKNFTLTCAREILITDEKRKGLSSLILSAAQKARSADIKASLLHEYEALSGSLEIAFADKYISYVYSTKTTLLDYLGKNTLTFAVETPGIADRLQSEAVHMERTTGDLIEAGLLLPKYCEFFADAAVLWSFFETHSALLLNNFITQYPGKLSGMFSFSIRPTPSVIANFAVVLEDISSYMRAGYSIVLLCENETEAGAMRTLLIENEIPAV
ncbi:MAG: hypothetical protein IKW18_06705, partial [Clostridia bacterium]|nr:hypothetical protein [Clostridia bacterium]